MITRFFILSAVVHVFAYYLFIGGGLRLGLPKSSQIISKKYDSETFAGHVSAGALKVTLISDLSFASEMGKSSLDREEQLVNKNLGIPVVTHQHFHPVVRGRFNRKPYEPNIIDIEKSAFCSGLIDSDHPDCRAIKPQP